MSSTEIELTSDEANILIDCIRVVNSISPQGTKMELFDEKSLGKLESLEEKLMEAI